MLPSAFLDKISPKFHWDPHTVTLTKAGKNAEKKSERIFLKIVTKNVRKESVLKLIIRGWIQFIAETTARWRWRVVSLNWAGSFWKKMIAGWGWLCWEFQITYLLTQYWTAQQAASPKSVDSLPLNLLRARRFTVLDERKQIRSLLKFKKETEKE